VMLGVTDANSADGISICSPDQRQPEYTTQCGPAWGPRADGAAWKSSSAHALTFRAAQISVITDNAAFITYRTLKVDRGPSTLQSAMLWHLPRGLPACFVEFELVGALRPEIFGWQTRLPKVSCG
jgi:hypothetical protein